MGPLALLAGQKVGLSLDEGDTVEDKTGNLSSAWGGDIGTIKRIFAV
jgi:hypothetical protein